jgi:Polyketide cyclase / dehydrase and lipid transport
MTRTYVSTVIPHSADKVWAKVKDFSEYRWGEGVGEARIENGLDPNTPGAIRSFEYYGQRSRQRLVTYSAEERMQSWESVEAFDPTLNYYKATLRITPVTISNSSFVEWWSDFDATPEATLDWQKMQQREFGKSFNRLKSLIDLSTAYYSTVLDHPVETVWSLIRDFNNYPAYIDGVTESVIEDSKRGDEVGAVRRFRYHDNWIRQQLAAHSDEHRSLTYAGLEPFAFPAGISRENPAPVQYDGTMHLLPIVDGTRTFIEWSVSFDAAPKDIEAWRGLLLTLIPDWTDSLRRALSRRN